MAVIGSCQKLIFQSEIYVKIEIFNNIFILICQMLTRQLLRLGLLYEYKIKLSVGWKLKVYSLIVLSSIIFQYHQQVYI